MTLRRVFGWEAVVLAASVLAVILEITYVLRNGTGMDSSSTDRVALGRSEVDPVFRTSGLIG
jgi:hypothetical protein